VGAGPGVRRVVPDRDDASLILVRGSSPPARNRALTEGLELCGRRIKVAVLGPLWDPGQGRVMSSSKLYGEWVVWLVESDLATSGQPEVGEASPPLLRDVFGELDAFGLQISHRCREVVTHEVQRLSDWAVGGVRGELRGRQLEDQPATARIDMGLAEHVSEEAAIRLWSTAEHDDVAADEHAPRLRSMRHDEGSPGRLGRARRALTRGRAVPHSKERLDGHATWSVPIGGEERPVRVRVSLPAIGYNKFMPKAQAALLLVDMQNESQYGIEGVDEAVAAAAGVLADWRAAALPVVYTRHVNRADATGLTAGEVLDAQGLPVHYRAGTQAVDIVAAIAPQQHDVVVDKHRWSGFYGTSLDLMLRSLGVERVVVGGFTTDCCVLATVFDACARDFRVSLVPDMCAATNSGSHQAAVLMMANWVYGIEILAATEVSKELAGSAHRSWRATAPDQSPFVAATLERSYRSLLGE